MKDQNTHQGIIDGYVTAVFADADLLGLADDEAVSASSNPTSIVADKKVLEAGRELLRMDALDWERVAELANRNFTTKDQTCVWLEKMLEQLEAVIAQHSETKNS